MHKKNEDFKDARVFKNLTDDGLQQIVEIGTVTSNGVHQIHCMPIIGQIEGHTVLSKNQKSTKYEQFIPTLIAIEQSSQIKGSLIVLNTVGGDVEAGLAIAELISGLKKPTVSIVIGGGHSIGVPLAVSTKFSFIVPSASMTIHPVRTSGMIIGVEQSFQHFKRMHDRIINFILKNSKVSERVLLNLMMNTNELANDVGSVVDGEKAVEIGLIDRVGSISDAISMLYFLIGKNEKEKEELESLTTKKPNRNRKKF